MYNLDINFLKDRGVLAQEPARAARGGGGPVNWTPAIAGLLVGLLFPLIAGVGLFFINRESQELAREEAVVDQELAELQGRVAEIEEIRNQTRAIESDTLALVKVFDRLQPWSAILQDVSNRVPTTVRLSSIIQDAETGSLTLSGNAESYEDVNDFVLKLGASPFFDQEAIALGEAVLQEDPTEVEVTSAGDNVPEVEIEATDVVSYTITAPIGEWSYADPEMVALLDQLGSDGLLARVEALGAEGLLSKLAQQENQQGDVVESESEEVTQ